MPQITRTAAVLRVPPGDKPLPQQVAEAVQSRTTPLSHLLRLMAALDDGDESLRVQLRARIGAPLSA